MFRKFLHGLLCLTMVAGVCVSEASAAEDYGKYKLKFSTVLSENSSWYKLGKSISARMAEETGGKVTINVFPNEQLSGGNQPKGLELLMSGSTEMDLRSGMLWATVDKRMGAISLPFFYKNFEQIDASFNGEGGKELKAVMEKHGIKLFGFAEGGWRQMFTSKKAVTALDQIKGMKFRLAPVPMNMDTFKALGANPLIMNWSEMFTGLQQGTVDGMECPISAAYESSVHEVCKNSTLWEYSYDCGLLSMNLKLWNSFPPKLQEIFTRVVEEEIAKQIKSERAYNKELEATMSEKFGVTFHKLSDSEREKFAAAAKVVVDNFEKEFGKEFVDKFR